MSISNVLIAGCGYLGQEIVRQLLSKKIAVTGWVRSDTTATELKRLGINVFVGDLSEGKDWKKLDGSFSAIIHCASSGRGGVENYRSVYLEGLNQLIAHQTHAKTVFVSSTSVYAQNDGSVVTEESPANPSSETSKILRQAEALGIAHNTIIARASGIYGPGRGVLMAKLLNGDAVIEGDGSRWINQIHRDDLASAVIHLLENGQTGAIYNCTDNSPASYSEFFHWASQKFNRPMPPFGPEKTDRKRGLTNKRVSNQKLLLTGWKPLYPTFREGYAQAAA